MKKISTVIGGAGLIIAFVAMSCDVENNPILAIPILIGFGLVFISYKIEKGWFDFEEDFKEIDSSDGNSCNDSDDDITYITYDSKGNDRYMDLY